MYARVTAAARPVGQIRLLNFNDQCSHVLLKQARNTYSQVCYWSKLGCFTLSTFKVEYDYVLVCSYEKLEIHCDFKHLNVGKIVVRLILAMYFASASERYSEMPSELS